MIASDFISVHTSCICFEDDSHNPLQQPTNTKNTNKAGHRTEPCTTLYKISNPGNRLQASPVKPVTAVPPFPPLLSLPCALSSPPLLSPLSSSLVPLTSAREQTGRAGPDRSRRYACRSRPLAAAGTGPPASGCGRGRGRGRRRPSGPRAAAAPSAPGEPPRRRLPSSPEERAADG